jgi:hypothetical protein
MSRSRVLAIFAMAVIATGSVWSQEPAPEGAQEVSGRDAPTSPEGDVLSDAESKELQEISGAEERPTSWSEFVEWWMTPRPFDKDWVLRIDENHAYPHRVASTKMIIVRGRRLHLAARRLARGPDLAAAQDVGPA